jgi:hypothetical protein
VSSVITSAVNPLAFARFSNERAISEVRGLDVHKRNERIAKGNVGERVCSPIKLVPSVAIRAVGCRHVFDGPGGCSTHNVRDANVPGCACTREFTVSVQNTLHANRRNEQRDGVFHAKDRGLVNHA